MTRRTIVHPSAWKATEFSSKEDIAIRLTVDDLSALDVALGKVRHKEPSAVQLDEFDLGSLRDRIESIRREILHGRGISILRGIPVDKYNPEEIAHIVWGLGLHLGVAVSQSQHGDRLGHVVDVSRDQPGERGYRSRKALSLHTDSDDIVMMTCIKQAKHGGVNRFASAPAIYNEILATKPHLLEPLFEGFRYHWRGEQMPGAPPITEYKVPVFSQIDGVLSCVFLREFIDMAADDLGQPLSALETEALEYFQAVADREDICFQMLLEPGDAFLINNFTVLHSRTAFEDFDEPKKRRHLLRLWLKVDGERPLADGVQRFYGVDGIQQNDNPQTVYIHESHQSSNAL